MRSTLLLTVSLLFLFSSGSFAQIIGTNAFLQGHWLEVGVDDLGAFGTCTSPAGYHAHGPAASAGPTCFVVGDDMDACYDWGHDGWSVGTPCEAGSYTIPGYPQEGWGIEIAGTEYRNWAGGGICNCTSGCTLIPGGITSYSNSGGVISTTWTGAVAGISVVQVTTVDTEASWVNVTTTMKNTTGGTIGGLYYERTCDPDNTTYWGGGPETRNVIWHQNEDNRHEVMVEAYGNPPGTTFNIYNSFLALSTKDCRAKAYVLESLYPTSDEATMWTAGPGVAGVSINGYHDSIDADEGIALVFNLGSLGAGDSNVVSYDYVYNGPDGIDSAFPDPQLLVNNDTLLPSRPVPDTVYDTFNVCGLVGYDSLDINILHGATLNWAISKWTWAPATGLTATTGTMDTIVTTGLPPVITYTIVGTDTSGSSVLVLNCEARVFLLTIMTCNQCTNNSPCAGDTLYLKLKGDSTGCTYAWTGPDGFTSTLQDPFIYPATAANTGQYYVIRTLLGVHDTDSTYATIHPSPIVTVSSNAPLCMGMTDTLRLSVTPYTSGETFSWTGPDTFTSALEFPVINGFTAINTGIYKVVATTAYGCTDSNNIDAELVAPPLAPVITGDTAYCYGSAFVPLVPAGSGIIWYTHDTSTTGTSTGPVTNTSAPGTYTYYATQQIGSCVSPKDSVKVHVYPRIDPDFSVGIQHGCGSDELFFTNTSRNSIYYTWNWGDGSGITDSTPALLAHSHVYTSLDTYDVILTAYNAVCSGDTVITVDTRHSLHALFAPVPDTFCVGDSSVFTNTSYAVVYPVIYSPTETAADTIGQIASYTWNFGDGSAPVTTTSATGPTHTYNIEGAYNVSLVITGDTTTCPDTTIEALYALQIHIHSVNDTILCLSQPLPLYNTITVVPNIGITDFSYAWTQSSPNLNDTADTAINVQVPYVTGIGDFGDTLTVTMPNIVPNGCPARDTITIHSVLGAAVIDVTPNTTIPYGSSIDLNASGQVYYNWLPNDGSLNNNNINNPVATPTVTTTYTVFGLDGNGCLDSAYVTISVDSTMYEGAPGAFTPNGDGLNDVWHPVGFKFQKLVEFRIYNRWGEQVFYSNDINKGWDGNYNGVPQDMGVYFYVIIISSPSSEGGNIVYKGDLTLLR